MIASQCKLCFVPLMVRIVHWEDQGNPPSRVATMWTEKSAYEVYNLPSNEAIEEAWCPQCGIEYHV